MARMKNLICKMLMIALAFALCLGISITAFADDDPMTFEYSLTSDGKNEKKAEPGDVITITFTVTRTDRTEDFTMYSMQDEIGYDDTFFELVDGGTITKPGVATADIGVADGVRSFYMNTVSFSGGEQWGANTTIGTFQLRVIGTSGSSVIRNENCKMGNKEGTKSYDVSTKDLMVVVSNECVVHFETYEGSEVPDQILKLGEKVVRPEDPTREGYHLEGWYKDIFETEEWNFDSDVVEGNMTLYAKWEEGDPEEMVVPMDTGSSLPGWIIPSAIAIVIVILLIILLIMRRNNKKEHTGG